jgi:hypothetical protein
MKKITSLSLLLLSLCLPHLSLAVDENQESPPLTHTIVVQAYCDILNLAENSEEYYNSETMGGEIKHFFDEGRFHYSVQEGVDPQGPMLGLTQADADFYCNQEAETFAHHHDTATNDQSLQFEATQNEDGTFQINVEKKSSPLMMFRVERGESKGNKENLILEHSDQDQSHLNDEELNRLTFHDSTLSEILNNNKYGNSTLIGHTGNTRYGTTGYVVLDQRIEEPVSYQVQQEKIKQDTMSNLEAQRMELNSERTALFNNMFESINDLPKAEAGKEKIKKDLISAMNNEIVRLRIVKGLREEEANKKIAQFTDIVNNYFGDSTITKGRLKQFARDNNIDISQPKSDFFGKALLSAKSFIAAATQCRTNPAFHDNKQHIDTLTGIIDNTDYEDSALIGFQESGDSRTYVVVSNAGDHDLYQNGKTQIASLLAELMPITGYTLPLFEDTHGRLRVLGSNADGQTTLIPVSEILKPKVENFFNRKDLNKGNLRDFLANNYIHFPRNKVGPSFFQRVVTSLQGAIAAIGQGAQRIYNSCFHPGYNQV